MVNILLCLIGLLALTEARILDVDKLAGRIVNGDDVKLGEIPYQVSLQNTYGHFCGGSIINKHWVVSAAHCVRNASPRNIRVLVGTVDLRKPFKYHTVSRMIAHEDYGDIDNYNNDISLIKVKEPFEFSENVKPVPLPEAHYKVKTNSTAVISGWGYLLNWSLPDILQKVSLFVADPEHCREVMKEKRMLIHDTQLCANDPSERKGECNGDSGSPVTVDGQLHGIVSWSIKDPQCGSPTLPGVHTRVSEFVDWILENIDE